MMTSSIHLSKELLEAVAEGRVEPELILEILFDHLQDRCRICREELRKWVAWRKVRSTPAGAAGVLRALSLLLDDLPAVVQDRERERRRAAQAFAELRRLSHRERLERHEGDLLRYGGTALATLCLEEVRRHLPDRPRAAWEWAVMADRTALWHVSSAEGPRARTLLALALAHQGNALRALEDFAAAEECFAEATIEVQGGRVTDLQVLAEIHCLEGSLHRSMRRFNAARRCLVRAELLYRVLRDGTLQGRTLLCLSTLYQTMGDFRRALRAAEEANTRLPADTDPRLRLAVQHNRADFLADLGRHVDAAEFLEDARPLYELFDDAWTRLRLAWLEGKIARGLGEVERAEERLRAARDGFAAEGSAYDAALVSLELALLYLDEGRTDPVRELAREMVATFRSLGIRREAVMAAALFAEVAERERVSVELVGRLAVFLRQSRGGGPVPAFQSES